MKALLRPVVIFGLFRFLSWILGHFIELNSLWPSWVIPLIGAIGVELVFRIYSFEQGAVSQRQGKLLGALRLAIWALLIWVLWQPVWSSLVPREVDQKVVILIDESASMSLVDEGQSESRLALAKQALAASGLREKLSGQISVHEARLARSAFLAEGEAGEGWDQATDLVGAFNAVLESVSPNELAGMILLSDGRHNRPGSIEDVARRFGILDAPIVIFPVGSDIPPQDVAIVSVEAPDSVYLGDKIRITALLKFDQYRDEKVTVQLCAGEKVLEQKVITIPQEHHREEVKFQYLPEAGGVGKYQIKVSLLEGERFSKNNHWDFQTVVSDARTNVLLIDSSPRWEFRYLRNLFYGRDQSIHLQSVLLEPDRVRGQKNLVVPASARRPFGDNSATALPANESEWRQFDVIILGDVNSLAMKSEEWNILRRCVEERGTLLVIVTGPKSMPHSFRDENARALIPVHYTATHQTYFGSQGEFRMALTAAGEIHPVLAQAEGQFQNEKIWSGFPRIRWSHPITGVKDGAEVLLYAKWPDDQQRALSEDTLSGSLQALVLRKEVEEKNALLVTRQTGHGKVAILLTDRTWRLREGVGDVYHHRFWGQLVKWGAGPNLRAGNKVTRLGTDHLTYTSDDQVLIMARLRDEQLNPRNDEAVEVEILHEGGVKVRTNLKYQKDSNGFYESRLGPFTKNGVYEARLVGQDVSTGFRVVGAMSGAELAETTQNRPLLENVARLSGGLIMGEGAQDPSPLFLLGKETKEELRQISLWDRWPVLFLFVILFTAEWILRRRSGLP